nr:PD-(D/E)XK nuclease family protein [Candidatus Omnitrophota bacterium]
MERVKTYQLSEDFIAHLTRYLLDEFVARGEDLSSLGIVFPGKRPALFLKRSLARAIGGEFFAPAFFSIDEFVEHILTRQGPVQKISDLDACFMIYSLAKKISPDILQRRESFSAFLPWAREIVAFIEQLDLEGIEDEPLVNIQNKAAIGYDVPENINLLLNHIIAIRKAFHRELALKHLFSRGLMYATAARFAKDVSLGTVSNVLFCGFFFLHKTEQDIIKELYHAGKADLFFQGDPAEWSVLDKLQEALSIRLTPDTRKQPEYCLTIQSGFDVHSEVCLVRQILKQTKQLDKTVVVLPEPANIIPLLSEISGHILDFNVSMGYPLMRSSLYALFTYIIKAQETKKNDAYYVKDYLRLLAHPLVKNLMIVSNSQATRVLVHKIEEVLLGIEETSLGGSLFVRLDDIEHLKDLYDLALATMKKMDIEVTRDELKDLVRRLHALLFSCWEKVATFYDFSSELKTFMDFFVTKSHLNRYPLNLKMADKVYAIQEELSAAAFNHEPFLLADIFNVFQNKLEREMISFSGSPLKGLQILGLFETRSLSFDNVIIMDMNESVLPSLKIYEPLIPREVMIGLGLNRLEHEEQIQRYQFKKLLASAKQVHLLYQQRQDKEKSRFIEELIWERQKIGKTLKTFTMPSVSFKVKVLPKKMIIEKNSKIVTFLKKKEYSASSINTYLNCPLQFYFRYVLGLEEREDLLEEPQGSDIGTFIHELLEEQFKQYIGKAPVIDGHYAKQFLAAMDDKFEQDFARKMKSDAFLIRGILTVRMQRFLENEARRKVH